MEISEHLSFYFHRKQLPLTKHKSSPKLNHSVLFRWFCKFNFGKKDHKKIEWNWIKAQKVHNFSSKSIPLFYAKDISSTYKAALSCFHIINFCFQQACPCNPAIVREKCQVVNTSYQLDYLKYFFFLENTDWPQGIAFPQTMGFIWKRSV